MYKAGKNYDKQFVDSLLKTPDQFSPEDLILNPNPEIEEPSVPSNMIDGLEDKGYVPPTKDQINSPGFQAASKYLSASGLGTPEAPPVVGRAPAEALFNKQESVPQVLSEEKQNPQSILEQYKKLMEAKQDKNRNLDMLAGTSKIAQAIASGYGAKVDDGSDIIKNLKESAKLPEEALLGQSKAVGVQNELEINDPNSDISKFARENAVAYAKKMGMSEDTVRKLEGLSAKQLEKLGFKNSDLSGNTKLGLYYTTIRDANGQDRVVGVDRATGKVVADIGGKTYADKIVENKQTGQNQIYRQGSGVSGLDTGTSATSQQLEEEQKKTNNAYESPQALNKVTPKLYADFKKTQDEFNKDMKESREVATATTNLSNKLKPGSNGDIDSGLLGGIQTQAAKMAGQKGVLTDQDLVKFAGAGGVGASIDRIIDGSMFGNMSDQDIKFFKAFAKKMGKSLEEDINNRSQLYVKQIHNEAKDYLPNLSEADVSNWLQVQSVAPSVQKKMIKVINPNGKTGMIPEENLNKALKQGYKKVD